MSKLSIEAPRGLFVDHELTEHLLFKNGVPNIDLMKTLLVKGVLITYDGTSYVLNAQGEVEAVKQDAPENDWDQHLPNKPDWS